MRVQVAYDDDLEVDSSGLLLGTEISRSGSPPYELNWPTWWQLLAFVHLSWCPSTFWKLNLLESIFFSFPLTLECACQGWIQSLHRLPHTGHPIHNQLSYTPGTHPKPPPHACPKFCWFPKHGLQTTFHANWLAVLQRSCRCGIPHDMKIANKMVQGMHAQSYGCRVLGFKRSFSFQCVPFQCSPKVLMFSMK